MCDFQPRSVQSSRARGPPASGVRTLNSSPTMQPCVLPRTSQSDSVCRCATLRSSWRSPISGYSSWFPPNDRRDDRGPSNRRRPAAGGTRDLGPRHARAGVGGTRERRPPDRRADGSPARDARRDPRRGRDRSERPGVAVGSGERVAHPAGDRPRRPGDRVLPGGLQLEPGRRAAAEPGPASSHRHRRRVRGVARTPDSRSVRQIRNDTATSGRER